MKKLILFILLIIMSFSVLGADPWTIEGNKVYINDSTAYISAEPHTAWNEYVTVELISKQFTGNINVLFGFDTSQVTPKRPEYYSHNLMFDLNGTSYYDDWHTITKEITKINRDFDDKDTWYLLQDVSINALESNKMRFYMETYEETKYDIIFYPSSYGSDIASANANGHLYLLDPWTGSPPINTQLYFDFEEGTGTFIEDLWFGNNGTATGGMAWSSSVPTFNTTGDGDSYSSYYDGTDDALTFTLNEYSVTDDFTISLWFKTTSIDANQILIQNTEDRGDTYFYIYKLPSNLLSVGIEGTTSTTSNALYSITSFSANTWYHIVYIFNGSNSEGLIYVNGVYDTKMTITTTGKITSDIGWSVGSRYFQDGGTGYDSFGEGYEDELKVYDYDLNSTEIINLYNCGSIECEVEAEPINIISKYYNGSTSDTFFTNTYINYTVNNTLNRTCNITLFNDSVEVMKQDSDITICSTGCDYSTLTLTDLHSGHNHSASLIKSWTFGANLCHENPTTSATLTLSCGIESESLSVNANEIPDCNIGTVFKTANFSICNGTDNVTIEITSNAVTSNKLLHIYNLTIGNEYDNITYDLTINGNESYLNQVIHYHTPGIKQISSVCSDNVSDTHNITLSTSSPFLIKNRLDTDCYSEGYTLLFDNYTFEYCSDDYVFNDIIQYGESLFWEYYIYCNDTLMNYENGTGLSVVQNLSELNVTDFQDTNLLECYKNVTLYGNIFNVSDIYHFNINDTVNPVCTGLNDTITNLNGEIELIGSCTDENFNTLNISCSDGSTLYNTSLSTELFNWDLDLGTLTNTTICYYSYYDGHPDDYNSVLGNFTITPYMIEEAFETLVCPAESTGLSILFSTLLILSFLLLMLGITLNKGVFTLLSGLMFLILSFSLYGCSVMIGGIFITLGVFLIVIGSIRQTLF